MKCLKFIPLSILFALVGCECDEGLNRVCPTPVECWVPQGMENKEENFMLGADIPGTSSRGVCQTGTTSCDEDGILFCTGIRYKQQEVCNFVDDDCDGSVDEGYDIDRDGVSVCAGDCDDLDPLRNPTLPELCNGIDDNCDGEVPWSELEDADGDGAFFCEDCNDQNVRIGPDFDELCDNLDNDCDGEIDEDVSFSSLCGPVTTFGACEQGFAYCLSGEEYCVGAIYPTVELCNGVDDDCNGIIDEGIERVCETQCGVGIESCNEGGWINCTAPNPKEELCDGFDNDCDGEIDEDCECIVGQIRLCATDVLDPDTSEYINCGQGLQECITGSGEAPVINEWSPCIWISNVPEECNNHDDDCDGTVDMIETACGESGTAGVGVCTLGNTICEAGIWGECEGGVEPQEEVCNEIDDDCDGEIDEELDPYEQVDMVFAIDGSGSMCAYANAIIGGLSQYVSDFESTDHRFALVIFPGKFDSNSTVNPPYDTITNLTDVNTFISHLSAFQCDFPGTEPSYDVMKQLASSDVFIDWRDDSQPYIIMMTDEPAQTWNNYSETYVSQFTNDCNVGACENGDSYEVFVFTHVGFFLDWDQITFGENERLISLMPVNAEAYAEKLRQVFTNVCL